ncbi:MAG: GNAT family N-acetyltransferase [Actinomycetota bacterium]|nr:GNAT family N-acetyltransferase [Actinomycetota bacterium]
MEDAYRRGIEGLIDTWRALGVTPGTTVVEWENTVALLTGLPHPIANQALVVGGTPSSTFDELRELYRAHNVPYVVQILDEVQPSLDGIARAAGFRAAGDLPFMVCSPIPQQGPPPNPLLGIERVSDEGSYEVITSILQSSFDVPAAIAPAFVNAELEKAGRFAYLLGSIGGSAVCTSSAFLGDGVVGIYCVGTLEATRRQGAGALITRAAIDAGVERGADLAFLQSSSLGFRVYERLGFRQVGYNTMYVPAN